MRILIAKLVATVALSALFSPAALAQGLAGAGGAGGTGGVGGGVAGTTRVVAGGADPVNRDPSSMTRVRTSQPPALDPSRRIYEVDCTKPFDALGKGNLRCM